MKRTIAVLIALAALPVNALAWSGTGHMIVGWIAYHDLAKRDPAAAKKAVTLLKSHPWYDRWKKESGVAKPPGDYLFMRAATWPDDIRMTAEDRPPWHFVDFPYTPPSTDPGAEPAGPDILRELDANEEIVHSKQKARQRAIALSWIIHLAGDIHQPLHCATLTTPPFNRPDGKFDKGGNRFGVLVGKKLSKLHTVWDHLLDQGKDPIATAKRVAAALFADSGLQRGNLTEVSNHPDPLEWSHESFDLATSSVYAYKGNPIKGILLLDKSNPTPAPDQPPATAVPATYISDSQALARRRVADAGYRLSDIVSDIL